MSQDDVHPVNFLKPSHRLPIESLLGSVSLAKSGVGVSTDSRCPVIVWRRVREGVLVGVGPSPLYPLRHPCLTSSSSPFPVHNYSHKLLRPPQQTNIFNALKLASSFLAVSKSVFYLFSRSRWPWLYGH